MEVTHSLSSAIFKCSFWFNQVLGHRVSLYRSSIHIFCRNFGCAGMWSIMPKSSSLVSEECQTITPLNTATGAKHVIPGSLDLTAAHSTLQPFTEKSFTALCDKDVTQAHVHQGYKRFYPPATWQVSGTIDPRDYTYIPNLIMASF